MKPSHSLIPLVFCLLPHIANAQGLLGHEVTIYGKFYDHDNRQPAWALSPYLIDTVLVGPGQEVKSEIIDLDEGGQGGISAFDFDAFMVEIDSSGLEGFVSDKANFNGFVIEDTNGTLPDFKTVFVDESVSTSISSRILVSPNSIWINDEGLVVKKDTFLRLLVTFADTSSEPQLSLNPSKGGDMILDGPTQLGARYRFEQSEDLVSFKAIDKTFTAVAPQRTIFIKPADRQMHYRLTMLAEPSIPLQADFESGADGWVSETVGGDTQWELGTPDLGTLTGVASGSTAWGTNLDDEYGPDAHAVLRSPLVDLSKHSNEAALTFRYVIDTPSAVEGGQLRIVDEAGTELYTHDDLFTGSSAGWKPFRLLLPESLQNAKFRIEFRFLSDGDDETSAGWFIDDVRVL